MAVTEVTMSVSMRLRHDRRRGHHKSGVYVKLHWVKSATSITTEGDKEAIGHALSIRSQLLKLELVRRLRTGTNLRTDLIARGWELHSTSEGFERWDFDVFLLLLSEECAGKERINRYIWS